jgi:hypothetical protein
MVMARGKKAAANDADFDQGGPDGPSRLKREAEANGSAGEAGMGHNRTYDGEYIRGAIEQIMSINAEIDGEKAALAKKLQPKRKHVAKIIKGMVESGMGTREVQTLLKKAKLERRLENVTAELDDDQKAEFQRILEAMGDFGDTPLGAAAIAAADGADTAEAVH